MMNKLFSTSLALAFSFCLAGHSESPYCEQVKAANPQRGLLQTKLNTMHKMDCSGERKAWCKQVKKNMKAALECFKK